MQDVCCYHSHANSEPVQEAASTGKLVPLLQLQVSGRASEDGKCGTVMSMMVCINKKLNPTFPPGLYRSYTLRRVRDHFRENKSLKNREEIEKQYKFGLESLEMLKRQVRAWIYTYNVHNL